MPSYQGSCHCGSVTFSFETQQAITSGLRCNCSICQRKGAVMSTFVLPLDALNVQADEADLGLYQFGEKTAKHYFCRNCGIYTFHETARFPGQYRVNLGCVDELDTANMPFEVFDGRHKL